MFRYLLRRYASSSGMRRKILIGLFVLLLVLPLLYWRFGTSSPLSDIERVEQLRSVSLSQVAALSTNTTPLSVVGEVRSESEAELLTEVPGIVTRVYRSVGEFVSAGTIIAEIENASQRASLSQAQAQVSGAEAALQKVEGGTRSEQLATLEANLRGAEENLDSARAQVVSTLRSSYAAIEEAVLRTTDVLLNGPNSPQPDFRVLTSRSQAATDIENDRVYLQGVLSTITSARSTLSAASDLEAESSEAQEMLSFTIAYLDTYIVALSNAIPGRGYTQSDIDAARAAVITARSALLGTSSTLTSRIQSLEQAQTQLAVAANSLEEGVVGAQSEDIAASRASLEQARASLRAAQASLEKTLIRTPISGRISTLSISTGEFVSQFAPAAVVSNQNALEIVTYVTNTQREYIAVGAAAVVNGTTNGVVTSIAPGLDPQTKKIEVRVGITDESTLTHGSSVTLLLDRVVPPSAEEVDVLRIPLSALKIGATEAFVFSVEEGRLVPHVVELGRVLGDSVVIESGITPTLRIVEDARGLKEGQEVVIAE